MRTRAFSILLVSVLAASLLVGAPSGAIAIPNPVATDEPSYLAFGRAFPDPQGCEAYGARDGDGDGTKDTAPGISPWAKARVCATQFLTYEEVVEGTRFLAARYPRYLSTIRLDEAYDRPYFSAGIPRTIVTEDGKVRVIGRDKRPLYLFKVTDKHSPIPERERLHFVYALSIHGIERAGLEGGIRAMEDLVTWAGCETEKYKDNTPACAVEGPFPKKIVEAASKGFEVPTAGEVLKRSVVYFMLANPDGWARGQTAPVEFEGGAPNANYQPGVFFQRYNGNGVDLNRDWPTVGYTFKPYSPASEPEVKAFRKVLRGLASRTADKGFAGGIDLHGMLTAYAFSYTLLGAGQRDYRKNQITVETSIRTFRDQTKRLAWSPYVADRNANGVHEPGELCVSDRVFAGTRGHVPACVADEWGTVIDTIGYQITGGLGDWFEAPIGLNAVGLDNEMYTSHLAPNIVFDPALEQSHVDGNKGLIYSQISALLTEDKVQFEPQGQVGYVYNPKRLRVGRVPDRGPARLPAQKDIEGLLPCQKVVARNTEAACRKGRFAMDGSKPTFEFVVRGPKDGFWNGGITVTVTRPNVLGMSDGNIGNIALQHRDEGEWKTAAMDFNQSPFYLQAGQVVTVNDPQPGRWRIWFELPSQVPTRFKVDFRRWKAEGAPDRQAKIDASSMDFFDDLNRYVPQGKKLRRVSVDDVVRGGKLARFDSLIVVNDLGSASYLQEELGLSAGEVDRYFGSLRRFARDGGNLVLTDAALQALGDLGVVGRGAVTRDRGLVGNYNFALEDSLITYTKPGRYPLARGVGKPGAAEQEPGRRQAVEPTPIGYSPDLDYDEDPAMPFWGVERAAWEKACGQKACTTALTQPQGEFVNLGEARLGKGTVRIAGILLPDPVFEPDEANDHRFGLASYALTYTAYEVFENLIAR